MYYKTDKKRKVLCLVDEENIFFFLQCFNYNSLFKTKSNYHMTVFYPSAVCVLVKSHWRYLITKVNQHQAWSVLREGPTWETLHCKQFQRLYDPGINKPYQCLLKLYAVHSIRLSWQVLVIGSRLCDVESPQCAAQISLGF